MSKKLQNIWPEVFVSTTATTVAVSRAVQKGKLRKLSSRLYTRNMTDEPERIIRNNLWQIVGALMPGALIADRTALENGPATDGSIFLIADRYRTLILPGITIKPRKGPAPLESDRPFIAGLYLSSTARAYLENMAISKAHKGGIGRTLSQKELEQRLEALLRRGGADALNRLRDEARLIAPQLGLEAAFTKLDMMIGAFLGTRLLPLETPEGKARQEGLAYDPERLILLQALHAELRNWPPTIRPTTVSAGEQSIVFAFYESYFSNFIEGTEFPLDEAASIIFDGRIPANRPADAHDILGTYHIAADSADSRNIPTTAEECIALLRTRHAAIMSGRPENKPGQFKEVNNQAGSTLFVAPELVIGTLHQGFALYRSLESPFQRAVFMMFLIAEVHPFTDGNGRTARLMMNAELSAAGEMRIIIPTVYRNNYLIALSALSQNSICEPLIRTLDFAQKWTHAIHWSNLEITQKELEVSNAFIRPTFADEQGIRLRMPNSIKK